MTGRPDPTPTSDPASQVAQLATDIEAEKQATVASRHDIAQAVQATHALQHTKHQDDITLLGVIRTRAAYLAELRRQVELLERENLQAEISIVSAIRAGILATAQLDADALLMTLKGP